MKKLLQMACVPAGMVTLAWFGGNGASLGSAICAGALVVLVVVSTIVPEAETSADNR